MAILSPSILAANFAHLEDDCRKAIEGGATMLHYDVMDGHFVPNISFGIPVLSSLHKALPDAFFDVHLMISDPLRYVNDFAKAGASLINFHYESECDAFETLLAIRRTGCKVGITIKPDTPVQILFPYLDLVDLVLIMTVEPGFGGQKFMPDMMNKVRLLRSERERQGLNFLIELDGGINTETGAIGIESGADVLVAGSTVFGKSDIVEAARVLSAL